MRFNFKKLKRIKKAVLTIFLASNLTMVATGSAVLNSATESADILGGESTSSTTQNSNSPTRTFKVDPTGSFIEDELVVKFKKDLPQNAKEGILSSHQASTLKEGRSEATLIKVDPSKRETVLRALAKNPKVEYVHENQVGYVQEGGGGGGGCFPSDYYYCNGSYQWGIKNVNVAAGWNYNKGSSSTKVAVIDTGVDYKHYDLGLSGSGAGKVIKGGDFVGAVNDYDPMDEDYYNIGHGTLVAGVLGAITNNGSAIAGVNWYTKIIAIRVANNRQESTEYDVAEGIYDAVNRGAQVINISLALPNDNPTLKNAVNVALSYNKIIVASVFGNTSTISCFMGFPAAYFGVISVAATEQDNTWWSGCTGNVKNSKTYQGIQVVAPGRDIFTLRMNSGIGYSSGTSLATPIVSGIASILVSCTDPTTAKYDLIFGADDLGSAGWDSTYGYGKVNLFKALDRHCY